MRVQHTFFEGKKAEATAPRKSTPSTLKRVSQPYPFVGLTVRVHQGLCGDARNRDPLAVSSQTGGWGIFRHPGAGGALADAPVSGYAVVWLCTYASTIPTWASGALASSSAASLSCRA